jgi:hypothetical protein
MYIEMYWGDQIRNNEMGRVCGMHGGEQRYIQCLVGNLNERDHMEQVSVCGRIILKWIVKIVWEGWDRIQVAQDRENLWALENTLMKLWVP